MERKYCVYVHTNKVNGKRYVGITCQKPENRWKRGYSSNEHFSNSIKKYGWGGFEHQVIATGLSRESACTIERILIKEWECQNPERGYNIANGGTGLTSVSESTKRKMSEITHKFYAEHPDARTAKMRAINQYTSDGLFVKRWDCAKLAEQEGGFNAQNISMACRNMGRVRRHLGFIWRYADEDNSTVSPYVNKHERAIAQFDTDGTLMEKWARISDAADKLGIDRSSISKACRGKIKTAGGYIWRYSNELQNKAI
jgi:group I intron endonuclease